MNLNSRNTRRVLLIIFLSLLALVGILHPALALKGVLWVWSALSPLGAGLCVAFILNVPLRFLEERCLSVFSEKGWWQRHRRTVCLTLTYLLALGVVCVLVFLVLPQLKRSLLLFWENLPGYLETLEGWTVDWLTRLRLSPEKIALVSGDWDALLQKILEITPEMMDSAGKLARDFFSGAVTLTTGVILSAYLLARKESLCMGCKAVLFAFLPRRRAEYLISAGRLASRTFGKFVSGQLTEAVILGLLCFLGMVLFRMPYPALISAVIGVTALIPIVGALAGTALGAFLLFMVRPVQALWFVLFIVLLQQVESNFIYPKVVGTSVGLPGIWVLLAVVAGGKLFGFVGMLLGIPAASVCYALFRQAVQNRLDRRQITKEELSGAGKEE